MVTTIEMTKDFLRSLDKHPHQPIIKEKIHLLSQNAHHPSLNAHQYYSARKGIWECYANSGDRILYEMAKDTLRLWYLGPHNMLDKAHQYNFASTKTFIPFNDKHGIATDIPTQSSSDSQHKLFDFIDYSSFSPEPEITDTTEEPPILPIITENTLRFVNDLHLRLLGVPSCLIPAMKEATTLDTALNVGELADNINNRLMEIYTGPEAVNSLFDPSLLVHRTTLNELEQYFGGKIKELMLKLQDRQQECIETENVPLILVKGTAGSGKTAVGIYRAIRQARQGYQVLFITYTNTLTAANEKLAHSLMGNISGNLRIATFHKVMMEILQSRAGNVGSILRGKEVENFLKVALKNVRLNNPSALLQQNTTFFEEEIMSVIKGLGIEDWEEYKHVKRYGRGKALQEKPREAVWEVYQEYQRLLGRRIDWHSVSIKALKLLQQESFALPYDEIIVDEAQDLTVVDRKVIQQFALHHYNNTTKASNIMILADKAQTIYSRNFSWKQFAEQGKAKEFSLRKNYRNTKPIAETATYLLKLETRIKDKEEFDEYIKPELATRQGLAPILVQYPTLDELFIFVRQQISDLISDHTFHLSDFAILCRTHELCQKCLHELETADIPTEFQGKDFNPLEERVKITTIHSAKGLEFPIVFLLMPPTRNYSGEEDLRQEWLDQERTLCYVGMTRAADVLYLLTAEEDESLFAQELDEKVIHW